MPMRALLIAPLLIAQFLSGCATIEADARVARSPFAAYDAARIAEGAYRASDAANLPVMLRLRQLDANAREKLALYRAQPDPERGAAAQVAVAALVHCLITDTEF